MELTQEEVLQILKLLDESDFDHLHLEVGDLKLIVSKSGAPPEQIEPRPAAAPSAGAAPAAARPAPPEPAAKAAPAPRAAAAEPPKTPVPIEAGLAPIKAPLLGTFYSRPDPASPPYVEVGKAIGPDDTVGLIEVMKLFTSVKAGVKGQVAQVCVQSGQMVEYGQVLFLVRPDEPGK